MFYVSCIPQYDYYSIQFMVIIYIPLFFHFDPLYINGRIILTNCTERIRYHLLYKYTGEDNKKKKIHHCVPEQSRKGSIRGKNVDDDDTTATHSNNDISFPRHSRQCYIYYCNIIEPSSKQCCSATLAQ